MVIRKSNRAVTERHEITAGDFTKSIMELSADSESINGLIYGDSNVGKTYLAGGLPGNTLWLVAEPGFKTAPRNGAKGKAARISNSAQALAAVDYIYNNPTKYDWIVIDGATTMQDRIRLAYTQEAFDLDPIKRQHRNLPDRPDYFNTQNFMKTWIASLIDAPVNLLITAHPYRTDNTENGELLVYPGFQGKGTEVSNAISGLMDFTGYMETRRIKREDRTEIVRVLWFESPVPRKGQADVRYICGSKFTGLQGRIVNPTMPNVLESISA
jgi:hypothetical protein